MIFGHNDITVDAPISRLDLLVCRNVLMYFVSETQRRVLSRFHYALGDGAYLFLGKAETILAHADLFDPVDTAHRIFARAPGAPARDGLFAAATPPDVSIRSGTAVLRELAAAATPTAHLVVDIDGRLVEFNNRARAMFGLVAGDLERPFVDLAVSHQPVELGPRIAQVYAEACPVVLRDVSRPLGGNGEAQFLEVTIAPLCDPGGVNLGVGVTFTDVTELGGMRVDLERSSRQLASTNEQLEIPGQ